MKICKKTLSVFLSLLMIFSVFGIVELAPTASAAYNMPGWDGSGTHWVQFNHSSGSEYVKLTYPSEIYLDISETLQSAGYYIKVTGNYGQNNTDYRVIVNTNIWGASNDCANKEFMNLFSGYSGDSSYEFNNIRVNQAPTKDNWDGSRCFVVMRPVNFEINLNLQGTPTKTGTYVYNSSGWNPSVEMVLMQNYSWPSWRTGYTSGSNKGSTSSYYEGQWLEIKMTAVVYNKSSLNSEINNATNNVSPNSAYTSLIVAGDWNTYTSALSSAQSTLSTRKVTQSNIDSAKNTLYNAANALKFAASDATLKSYINQAENVMAQADYALIYTAESRAALESALNAAKTTSYSTAQYAAYNDANAGSKAKQQQNIIDGLAANLNSALSNMGLAPVDYTEYDNFVAKNTPLEYGTCYTDDTLNAYNSAIATMEDYKADTSLTRRDDQSKIDNAMNAITDAFAALTEEHTWNDGEITTPATCTTDGVMTYTCTACGKATKTETIPATGHEYGSWTSNNNGTHSQVCIHDDDTNTEDCTYTQEVVAPTCTEQGYTLYTCSVCGYSYEGDFVPATGHSMGDWESDGSGNHTRHCNNCDYSETKACDYTYAVTTPATCTSAGEGTYTCSVCGYSYTEVIPVNPEAHKYDGGVYTAPTCTEDGYTTYTCEYCGGTKVDIDEGSATGHNFGAWVPNGNGTHTHTCENGCGTSENAACTDFDIAHTKEPNCTETGLDTYTCNDCGYVKTEVVAALGHDYVGTETKAPTCTEEGVMTYECSRCHDTYTESISAKGHSWGDVQVITQATCTTTGIMSAVCKVCGEHQSEAVIPARGHNLAYNNITETQHREYCTNEANDQYEACNYEITEDHDFSTEIERVEPTCTTDGYVVYQCECGQTNKVELSATGHTEFVTINAKAPTCTQAGWTEEIICSVCNETLQKSQPLAALGHDWQETEHKDATCTDDGYTKYDCSRCDETKTDVIPATGHTWDEGTIKIYPTCTSEGSKEVTCQVCGTTEVITVPKLEHSYVAVVTPPTCTANGFTTYTCSVCHDTYQSDIVPATGHQTIDTVVAPTCTERGYTKHECTVCGYVYNDNYVAALGHKYTETVVAPTCTAGGYTEYTCSVCGHSYRNNFTSPVSHNYVTEVVPATCTEQGYTLHKCTNCGDSYKDNFTDAIGHEYVEADRVPPSNTQNGYIVYRCKHCSGEYKEIIYAGNRVLVSQTLYDVDGRILDNAKIYVMNVTTGDQFLIETDDNGYFTYVFTEGKYELLIKHDFYLDTYGTIIIADGEAEINIDPIEHNPCDCLCHQDNIWATLFRILYKILYLFGFNVHCCDDCAVETW